MIEITSSRLSPLTLAMKSHDIFILDGTFLPCKYKKTYEIINYQPVHTEAHKKVFTDSKISYCYGNDQFGTNFLKDAQDALWLDLVRKMEKSFHGNTWFIISYCDGYTTSDRLSLFHDITSARFRGWISVTVLLVSSKVYTPATCIPLGGRGGVIWSTQLTPD